MSQQRHFMCLRFNTKSSFIKVLTSVSKQNSHKHIPYIRADKTDHISYVTDQFQV